MPIMRAYAAALAALASVAADAERDRLRPRVAPIDLKLEHHQALRLAVVAHA